MPGWTTREFEDAATAKGLPQNKAREFLRDGVRDGTIKPERGEGRRNRAFYRTLIPDQRRFNEIC
jgi:hypothetical protein